MTKPFTCERTAVFTGQVSDFKDALDPQLWSLNAQEIWSQSYVIAPSPGGLGSIAPGIPAAAAPALPVGKRTDDPPYVGARQVGWGPPVSEGLFFEEALFLIITFRNVLATRFVDDSTSNSPSIRFDYREYDCLTTTFPGQKGGPVFGGVDVDNGFSECVPLPDPAHPEKVIPGQVKITFAKTVRFTQPSFCVNELNALATILLPLVFDMWIQNQLF